jgi:hypothetical protein
MSLSLMHIMRDDPDFTKRLNKKVEEIKVDKQNLLNTAEEYSSRYRSEVNEGTQLRAKLLSEGASKGLSESQVMSSYGRFVPTVQTPVLNLLYFLLRESDEDSHYGKGHYQRRDAINEELIKRNQLEHDDTGKQDDVDLDALLDHVQKLILEKTNVETMKTERSKLNAQFENVKSEVPKEDATQLKDTPDMVEYLYGNTTLEKFNLIKKLKALSQSPNESEAFQAYRKANELCKEEGLEFDKIPCYVEKRK